MHSKEEDAMSNLSEFELWANYYAKRVSQVLPHEITNELIDELAKEDSFNRWGFCWCDLSQHNLSQIDKEHLKKITFSTSTIWPNMQNMPKDFDPAQIIENGKNPMLNINELHKNGITGKGVLVAVIDSLPVNPKHVELNSAKVKYENVCNASDKHFHGDIVLANICGKNIGVAPDVFVYHYCQSMAIEKINKDMIKILFDILHKIENGEPIKIVSRSGMLCFDKSKYDGLEEDRKSIKELKNKIESLGCKVLDSIDFAEAGFHCGHFCFDDDNKNIDNIKMASWLTQKDKTSYANKMIFVCGGKSIPDTLTNDGYKFEQDDCFSWTIPQCAGLYALCLQANSNLSFEDFIELCRNSCDVNKNGYNIINPQHVINKVFENNKSVIGSEKL